MKGETNLALAGFWELIAEEQTLRKASSDSGCMTLNRSATRLLHVMLVELWNWMERCDDWHM